MGIIQKFFEALLDPKAATWSAGVSFNRSNPLPLDKWSVFQSMDAATTYAETNAVAYPGQVIAVYNNGKMVAYVLSEDVENTKLVLEPIGIIPTGDGAISVDANGVISVGTDGVTLEVVDGALTLVGFEEAPEGAQLVKAADGSLSWVKPDLTTVEGLQTAVETLKQDIQKIEQALNPTDEEGNPVEGGLVSDVKDLEDAVGEEAVYDENGELISEATGIFKDIEDIEDKIGNAAEYDEEGSLAAEATGLYAELDKKADKDAVEEALDLKADIEDVDAAIDAVEEEVAKKANAADVEADLALKANAADVYTKEEANNKIASDIAAAIADADHLSREIVENFEAIDPAAEGADKIIYMVPTGLQEDDDKYDEYMVINGSIEKVGSWEVNLSAYAKTEDVNNALALKANAQDVEDALALKANADDIADDLALKADAADVEESFATVNEKLAKKADAETVEAELAKKVDAVEGSRLMTSAEGDKLAAIEAGAQKNYITSTSDDFDVTDGNLTLVEIDQSKVKGLAEAFEAVSANLDDKVDAVEGSRLMTDAEGEKLAAVNVEAEKNVINSVSADFKINNVDGADRQLVLKPIAISKVTDLESKLNSKVDKQDGWTLLSPTDQAKLAKLVIDDESGDIGISATVNVENIQGLEDWLAKKAGEVKGLSENNLTNALHEKLVNQLFIKTVDENQLAVTDGHLTIKAVNMNQVTGLNDILDLKASTESVTNLTTRVGSLETSLNTYKTEVASKFDEIDERLMWHGLSE